MKNGQLLKELPSMGKKTFHICKIFTENIVTFSTNNKLRVWDVETGNVLKKYDFKDSVITCIRQFSSENILIGDAKRKNNGDIFF